MLRRVPPYETCGEATGFSPWGLHFQKDLRIGYHQLGGSLQPLQGVAQFPLLYNDTIRIIIEEIPDRLDLRKDEAAFRRFFIDGNDKECHLTRPHEITQNGRVINEF
jgi:hypothetical protein